MSRLLSRRTLLKGAASGIVASAAASFSIRSKREQHRRIYDRPTVQTSGFGLARVKREGEHVPYDPGAYYPKVCPCGVRHRRPGVPNKCWVRRTREACA